MQVYNNQTDYIAEYEIITPINNYEPNTFSITPPDPSTLEATNQGQCTNGYVSESCSTFEPRKLYYLRARIVSDKYQKIILGICAINAHKYWLNGTLLFARGGDDCPYKKFVCGFFHEGINEIVIEMYKYSNWHKLQINIYNFVREASGDINSLSCNYHKTQYKDPYFIHNSQFCCTEKYFAFMAYSADEDYTKTNYTYEVRYLAMGHNHLVYTVDSSIGRMETIDLDIFRTYVSLLGTSICNIRIVSFFRTNENNTIEKRLDLYPIDFLNEKVTLEEQLREALNHMTTEQISWYKCALNSTSSLSTFEEVCEHPSAYLRLWEYQNTLLQINHAKQLKIPRYFPEDKQNMEYALHSNLDDQDVIIRVRTFNINNNQPAPLFVSIPTIPDSEKGSIFHGEHLGIGVIHADVNIRGLNGGGYVGEASFFETFNWICANYNVDKSRIYLIGHCNGAHAALHIAQSFPHLFAAMYILSGLPRMDLVENLSNLPIYYITSNYDKETACYIDKIIESLAKYRNFHYYPVLNTPHDTISVYTLPATIPSILLQHKRNAYPKEIVYTTGSNRYLQSYWIELGSISSSTDFAHIHALIENSSRISISVRGVNEFAICIPPQVSIPFTAVINGTEIYIDASFGNSVVFSYDTAWHLKIKYLEPIDFRLGAGLLDIYLAPMRIIIPDNASEAIKLIAHNLSTPKSYSSRPQILVNYPIYPFSGLPSNIHDYNLIIISDFCARAFPKIPVDLHIPIQCLKNGFIYQNQLYTGDYVVMQIIGNPRDPKKSIMCITYSNEHLLTKNLFLRNMTLPYAAGKYHDYLNHVALIWKGGKYYYVDAWGMPLCEK